MTFLNPRRARPEEEAKVSSNRPSDKAKRRKSSKAADTEAEISRYFTSAKMTDQNATKRQPQQKRRDSHGKIRTHDSPPAFIELPNTPFLGFGSSGGNSVSPVKKLSSPALKDLERRLTRSVIRSTSYLTWSESGTPSQGSLDSKRRRIIPLNSSRLSNCNARSPAPHKARLSNAPNSSPCAPKAPLEKPDRISSTAPKDQITHTARHSQDCSPQAGVKRTSDTTVPEEHQGPGKTRVDKRDDPQYASKDAVPLIQIPRSPDQHHDDSGFLREDAKFSHANQSQNRATTPVQTPNLRGRETVSPLEDTLEALLQECRARRKIEGVPPSVDQSRSNTLRNNENMPHRQSDHISPRSENPCRNAPAPSSRSQVSVPPRVDRGNEYAKFALRDHRPESPRHGTVSSRQTRSTPLSNIPFLSESSRGNSRSAWTGYENMYERQQDLDQPTIPNERDYEVDQLRTNSADYDEIPINPSVFDYHNQEQRYRIDDGAGTGEYARDEELGHWPTNEMPAETEALNCQDGWHDVEADLFAEYEQETPFQNNKSGQQNHELFREPQQHSGRLEGADESDYPYVQDGPSANRLWLDNASYPPENSGHGNRNANVSMQDSTEDPALSTFWTPHRLY